MPPREDQTGAFRATLRKCVKASSAARDSCAVRATHAEDVRVPVEAIEQRAIDELWVLRVPPRIPVLKRVVG